MVQIGFYILARLFSALLPPVDPNEDNFYEILGLEKNATNEQIRKAYKKTSLRLHPDKVAQRGDMDKDEAAAKYEKVQEAYGVLVNDEKRDRYHALSTSTTRYRFIEQGGLTNPGSLYENLTSASLAEKTKLVGMAWVIMLFILIQPILLGAKINQFLEGTGPLVDVSWAVIFTPFWIFGLLGIAFWSVILYFAPPGEKILVIVAILEQVFWYLTVVFLTVKWDGWDAPYRQVLIPFYIAYVIGWIKKVLTIFKIRGDVAKMVTMDYLENEILQGKNLDDLTSEEEMQLRKDYIIVSVPPEFEPIELDGVTPDEKILEEQKVEASPEYEAATDMYNATLGTLYGSVAFSIVFLILLTLKLDDKISGNWWVVFTPFLIYIIARLLNACFILVCGSGEEIALQMQEQEEGDNSEFVDLEGNATKDGDKQKGEEKGEEKDEPATTSESNTSAEAQGKADEKNTPAPAPPAAAEEASTKTESTPAPTVSSADTSSKPNGDPSNNDTPPKPANEDDSDDEIHIDEETFKAWQSAYVEAEKNAMEAIFKAAGDCCMFTFQLIFLCLIIAKIDKNYDDIDPDDVGFDVFWILSPLFIVFGCIGVCCACLIYGAAPGNAMDLTGEPEMEETAHNFEDPETGGPIVTPPPAPIISEPPKDTIPLASAPAPAATEPQSEPQQKNAMLEESPDMEDLD
ncbi:unnamed protein product [Cylindrotheca closterium]|uniref:J domain-containing protein n=1 Tax=Cylindrotheca closterium TaxID=2856 RepID=A0AAD2CDL1_9STRA|nr:unnamed protein product [Cylindrotheca closterium]